MGRSPRTKPRRLGEKLLALRRRLQMSQTEMARAVLHHRDRKALREFGERSDGGGIAPGARGNDERVLRRQDPRSLVDCALVRARRRCRDAARRGVI